MRRERKSRGAQENPEGRGTPAPALAGLGGLLRSKPSELGLNRVKPPQFFQFRRQPVAERAFWAEVIQQGFRLLERFLSQFSPLVQHPTPRARHFLFGEQAKTPNQMQISL
jgi:hypothetical protein